MNQREKTEKEVRRNLLLRQELLKQVFENLGLGSFFQLETKDFVFSSMPMAPDGKIVGELSYEEKIFFSIIKKIEKEVEIINEKTFEKLENEDEYPEEQYLSDVNNIHIMMNTQKIAKKILYSLLEKEYDTSNHILRVVDGWKVQLTPSPNGEV